MISYIVVPGSKGVYEIIKRTCLAYPGLSFTAGIDFNTAVSYPASFLELPLNSATVEEDETFSIALQVADLIDKDAPEEVLVDAISKVEQILAEVHHQIGLLAHHILVSDINIQTFPNYDENNNFDGVVIARGEFQITIARYTSPGSIVFKPIDLSDMI